MRKFSNFRFEKIFPWMKLFRYEKSQQNAIHTTLKGKLIMRIAELNKNNLIGFVYYDIWSIKIIKE